MKLKTGDKIYATISKSVQSVYTVERTTATQAICGNKRFKIEYGDSGYVNVIGASTWDVTCYHLETPELKLSLDHQISVTKISKISFGSLSTEQLTEILKIANQ